MTDVHFSTGADARPCSIEQIGREAFEDEFLRLFALRDAIGATLWSMKLVLDGNDAETSGGVHV